MRRFVSRVLVLACLMATTAASAAPHSYHLDASGSEVGFTWFFGQDAVQGKMPVSGADLVLDFNRLAASSIQVTLNVAGANAGFPFADQAMKGPQVLDADAHPQITFVSHQVAPSPTGATVEGDLTIRGVTRPATLAAELYRQSGSQPEDLSHLVILLTGQVDRRDFGATGWADMVGPEVQLRILARISVAD